MHLLTNLPGHSSGKCAGISPITTCHVVIEWICSYEAKIDPLQTSSGARYTYYYIAVIAIAIDAGLLAVMAAIIWVCLYFKKKRGQKHPEDIAAANSETSEEESYIFKHTGSFGSMHELLGLSININLEEATPEEEQKEENDED